MGISYIIDVGNCIATAHDDYDTDKVVSLSVETIQDIKVIMGIEPEILIKEILKFDFAATFGSENENRESGLDGKISSEDH